MTQRIVAEFSIPYTQFMDRDGQVVRPLPAFATPDALKTLYEAMLKTRLFDAKAIALQRTGKMGTYPSVLGQEAIGVGLGVAMRSEDVLCPYYRELGAQLWRGVKMEDILLYWGGDERGSDFAVPRYDFPICVPIASQTLHAVGVAAAFQYRKEKRVAVTAVGDGGTSRGDFYEAMNVAGAWQLPVVFIVNNNRWAISVPLSKQTHAQTMAQKGIAAGIPSEQVDGNDVVAVQHVVQAAVERARAGEGPTLIEALSYRMGDHTTADDARRYRSDAEKAEYQLSDPIERLKKYLVQQKAWDEATEEKFKAQCSTDILKAVAVYESTAALEPAAMFDHLYATLPEAYAAQREELENMLSVQHTQSGASGGKHG